MDRLIRLRRVGRAVLRAALKSVLIAALVICIVYPTTTLLSITRTPLAVPSHHSSDGHHKQHQGFHDVDTGMHEVLGAQANMMIEHVPLLRRDTESTLNDYWGHGRKHGRSGLDLCPPLERSVGLKDGKGDIDHHSDITIHTPIFDRAAQASGGGWGRVDPNKSNPKPKPRPHTPPPQVMTKKVHFELQRKNDCWDDESVYPAISARDPQDSAGPYGPCARPKNKKLPTKAMAKTDAPDKQLAKNHDEKTAKVQPRENLNCCNGRPCMIHRPFYCPHKHASKLESKTTEIQSRKIPDRCKGGPCLLDRPRFGPPAVALKSESKTTEIKTRKIPSRCRPGRPCHWPRIGFPAITSKLESKTTGIQPRKIPCQPFSSANPVILHREETVLEGKFVRPSNFCTLPTCPSSNPNRDNKRDGLGQQDTRIADVITYLSSRGVNNSTGINFSNGTQTNNGTQNKNGTLSDDERKRLEFQNKFNLAKFLLWTVGIVTALCFTLLGFICVFHFCTQRQRRNAVAARRMSYPSKPEISHVESAPTLAVPSTAPTNGNIRMNRIDEEVAEEDAATQRMTTLDGANDGWTRWLLQKRDTRKPKPSSPPPKTRPPPRIPTLRLPQPTFSSVRKANGIKTETRAETSMGYDWFRSKGRDTPKTKGTSVV